MTLHLQVPCEGPELTDVIIHNDGSMEFPDFDIERDLMKSDLLGEEPSLCAEVYLNWENDPLDFICASGLFPIDLTGRIMTSWCEEAVRLTKDPLTRMGCYKAIAANVKACESFWNSKRMILKKVYQTKLDVVNCWNKYARDARVTIYEEFSGQRVKKIAHKVVDTVCENAWLILDIVNQMETTGGVYAKKNCTNFKVNIRDIFYAYIERGHKHPLDIVPSIDEEYDMAEAKMFDIAMEEIKRYER